jgi:hypothetical protein
MKKLLLLGALILISSITTNIYAGQKTNELGVCLTDSLTGKERKNLAKWIFFSMSVHPEISIHFKVPEQTIDKNNEYVGNLMTRLLAEDCPNQTKAALKEAGSTAMENAFEIVGRVAMQELMRDQSVTSTIGGFEKYLDTEKLKVLNQ